MSLGQLSVSFLVQVYTLWALVWFWWRENITIFIHLNACCTSSSIRNGHRSFLRVMRLFLLIFRRNRSMIPSQILTPPNLRLYCQSFFWLLLTLQNNFPDGAQSFIFLENIWVFNPIFLIWCHLHECLGGFFWSLVSVDL